MLKAYKITVHRSWHVKIQEILISLIYKLITNSPFTLEIKSRRYLHFLQEIYTEYVLVKHTYMSLLWVSTCFKTSFETRLVLFVSVEKNCKFSPLSLHFPFSSHQTDLTLDKMDLMVNTLLDHVKIEHGLELKSIGN